MVSVLKCILIWVGICYLQIPLAAVFVWAYPRQSAWLRDRLEKHLLPKK